MSAEAQILFADDELGMREMVGLELGQLGHNVVLAKDGKDAIARLGEQSFDLVITDVRMPGADGIAVLKAARNNGGTAEVILLTGYANMDLAVECVRSGAHDLIQKPFHLVDLLSAVKRALEHRKLRVTARLYAACNAILTGGGGQSLYERIGLTAMRLLGGEDVGVMLMDAQRVLRIVFTEGGVETIPVDVRLALADRVAGGADRDTTPALLPEALQDDPRFRAFKTIGRVRAGIIYPLTYSETVLGVININRVLIERRFCAADLEIAGIVAAQSALAIWNEQLTQHLVASERLTAIGQVASGIIHEISNPLAYITANAAFMRDTLLAQPLNGFGRRFLSADVDEEVLRALADVEHGATLLQEIVADMRSISRGGQDTNDVFELNNTIRSAIRISGPRVRQAAVLEMELQQGVEVRGHSGRIGQVILNLLVNAAQAIEETGREDGRIVIRSKSESKSIVVEVIDNGAGIASCHIAHIMEPFYTTKTKEKGTGLGLAICREIVHQHGGELELCSEVGRGTTVRIELPSR